MENFIFRAVTEQKFTKIFSNFLKFSKHDKPIVNKYMKPIFLVLGLEIEKATHYSTKNTTILQKMQQEYPSTYWLVIELRPLFTEYE